MADVADFPGFWKRFLTFFLQNVYIIKTIHTIYLNIRPVLPVLSVWCLASYLHVKWQCAVGGSATCYRPKRTGTKSLMFHSIKENAVQYRHEQDVCNKVQEMNKSPNCMASKLLELHFVSRAPTALLLSVSSCFRGLCSMLEANLIISRREFFILSQSFTQDTEINCSIQSIH